MAGRMEGQAVRLLPASPVFGRLIQRIRALDGSAPKRKKWAATVGDEAMNRLLGMETSLVKLQKDLVGFEKTLTMAADLAPWMLQIRDAAERLHDILDNLEYGRIRSRLAKKYSEVRKHPSLLIPSLLFLGRFKSKQGRLKSKHGKHCAASSSVKIDQIRLLEEFGDGVAQSTDLIITLLAEEKASSNPGVLSAWILALDPPGSGSVPATVSLEHRVFGRGDEQDNMVGSLINSSYRLSVVFMVGRRGVGKTKLAQLVYDDTRVKQHFDLRIWVSVSGSLNKVDITREILQSADPGYADKMATANFQMLQSELSSFVASHRFLLVLDDQFDCSKMEPMHTENWTDVFAPLRSAETGSSVLVTTPMMMAAPKPVILDRSKCSDLFMECALSSKNLESSPELEHIAMEMADKLQGLPLAAKELGGVLGATSSTEERRSTMDRIISGYHSAQLRYDFLPAQLKICFAYCSLFPKDWKFDRTKLVHLWMAEGFLERQEDPEKRMEDLGSKYFDDLVSLSCFQEHRQGSKTYYTMHPWFHDLAEAVSANVCFRIEPGSSVEVPPTACHLSVTTDTPLDLNGCCLPKQLRTLLVLRSPLHSLQDDHLQKLRKLRVLDLCGCNLAQLPESIGELVHLRYLSLCGTLRRLPESLGSLLHLQVLCFPEDCCLDELPTGTTNLINLRHLDIDTKYITKLAGIRHLVNLQGLVEIHVEKGGGHSLQDLSDMNGLRGHLSISGLDNVSSKEEVRRAKLNNKQYLTTLKLEWTTANRIRCHTTDAEVLENLQPHPNIKELFIRRYGGSVAPSWLQFPLLKELQSLHLINCRNLSVLPPLGQLPSLEKLYMKELCTVTQIGPEFYSSNDVAFPSLEILELVDLPRLLEWSGEVKCTPFPCLKSLRLIDCPELKQIPSLPASTTEVTVERVCSIRHLKFARFSSSSVMLTLDSCMTTVLCKTLFLQQHLETITDLSINGGKLFYTTEGLSSLLSLQKLQLCQSDMTDHSFGLFLQALPSLSSLEMINLPNITALPVQADVNFFSTLAELRICNCPLLSTLSSLQVFTSLKCLVIERCPKLTTASFPTSFGSLGSLKMVSISYCSQLQSLPAGGLPSSVQTLNPIGCHPKLVEHSRNKEDDSWKKIATVPE